MSTYQAIQTEAAPAAIGPYSQAIVAGGLLFASGQIPLDPQAMTVCPGGITEQTEQVCRNLRAVLAAAGAEFRHVTKTSVFLQDLAHFAEMNRVYALYFAPSENESEPWAPPARSTVQVAALPRGVLVEIECIAVLPERAADASGASGAGPIAS